MNKRLMNTKYVRLFYYPKWIEFCIALSWEDGITLNVGLLFWDLEIGRV